MKAVWFPKTENAWRKKAAREGKARGDEGGWAAVRQTRHCIARHARVERTSCLAQGPSKRSVIPSPLLKNSHDDTRTAHVLCIQGQKKHHKRSNACHARAHKRGPLNPSLTPTTTKATTARTDNKTPDPHTPRKQKKRGATMQKKKNRQHVRARAPSRRR